jgi:hypothetical protein
MADLALGPSLTIDDSVVTRDTTLISLALALIFLVLGRIVSDVDLALASTSLLHFEVVWLRCPWFNPVLPAL